MRKGIIARILACSKHLKYWYHNLSSSDPNRSIIPPPFLNRLQFGRLSRRSPISSLSSALDILRVDARRTLLHNGAETRLIATVIVLVLQVEGVDVAWEVAETGEADVDEEVGAASGDQEDTHRWDEDGDDNDKDGRDWVGHFE